MRRKNLFFDSFTFGNAIYEQTIIIDDYDKVDGLLGCLDAQGWLLTFPCLESNAARTPITDFYDSMEPPSLLCVRGLVDNRPFRVFANNISKLLRVLNEGDVTYFENVTSNILFQKYIPAAKLHDKLLKPWVRYKNVVSAKDLTPLAFTFWLIMVSIVLFQGGHLNDVTNFGIYVHWMFVSWRMINLPI